MAAASTEPGARLDGMKVVHAVCSHDCPDSCGVLVTVDEATGRAVKVQGDPSHPVTRGFLCGKVAKYLDRVSSPARLFYPMRRWACLKLGPPAEDFAHAGLIIAWGANVHGNNVHLWPFIEEARRKGAKLVVIDPYRTRTAALADEHLAINPGTDAALALGMMHAIFSMGLEGREYIARCATGLH